MSITNLNKLEKFDVYNRVDHVDDFTIGALIQRTTTTTILDFSYTPRNFWSDWS